MKKLELENLGLNELSYKDAENTNGGVWWVLPAIAVGLIVSAVNNFGDIRQGVADGFRGTPSH